MKTSLHRFGLSVMLVSLLAALTSCGTPGEPVEVLPPGTAFVGDFEEASYSEILQGNQRIVLSIELVDGVRPPHRLRWQGQHGYVVPAGERRVQFRVLLPSAGLTDSHAREARGFVDVRLVAGHRYRIAGHYGRGPRTFHLLDTTTNEPVSSPVDLRFFGPVRRDLQFVPIIIPLRT